MLGLEDPKNLTSEGNLAMYLPEQGRYSEAEEINRKVHAAQKRTLGEPRRETLSTGSNFASCLTRHGEFAEAEEYNRSALDGMKRAFRTEHPKAI